MKKKGRRSRLQLKYKFLLLYLFCFILPFFGLDIFLLSTTTASMENTLLTSIQISLNQTDQLMENRIREATSYLSKLAADDQIQTIFSSYCQDLPSQVGNMLYLKKSNITYAMDYQTKITPRFYANNGEYYWSTNEGFFFDMNVFSQEEWFVYTEQKYPYIACLPESLSPVEGYIHFATSLHDANQYQRVIGVICADVSVEDFRSLLQSGVAPYDAQTFLVTNSGELVCHLGETPPDDALIAQLSGFFEAEGEKFSYEGTDYFIFSQPLSGSDWTRVTLVSQNMIFKDIITKNLAGYILFLLCGTAAFLFAYAALKVVIRRIDILKSKMAEVKNDSLVPVENDRHDEIGELMDGYNFMIAKVKTLLEKQYAMGLQVKDAELKALQAQINPHFLYNALSMINWLSEEERPEDITRVISALSRFYRLSLNHGENLITLKEEIQLVECFVYIQKMRYDSEIILQTEIDPDCLSLLLPKLTLQPVVENAIAHGILPKPVKNGLIRITGVKNESSVVLQISDDGLGMSPERLQQVQMDQVESGSGNHYGIRNVKERLELCFGKGCHFEVESVLHHGTTVTIQLPLHPHELSEQSC